jgi:hypothetical protein
VHTSSTLTNSAATPTATGSRTMQTVAVALLSVTACPQCLVKVVLEALHLSRCTTEAHKHRRIVRRECVHRCELVLREPLRHEECSKRDEGDDEDREADGCNRLRDCNSTGNTEGLQSDIQPDLTARNGVEWVLRVDEALFGVQIPELRENAVTLDRTPLISISTNVNGMRSW